MATAKESSDKDDEMKDLIRRLEQTCLSEQSRRIAELENTVTELQIQLCQTNELVRTIEEDRNEARQERPAVAEQEQELQASGDSEQLQRELTPQRQPTTRPGLLTTSMCALLNAGPVNKAEYKQPIVHIRLSVDATNLSKTRMWADVQRDGRPSEWAPTAKVP